MACLVCGYDLAGTPHEAPCPECGRTLKASRRFMVNTILGPDAARLVQLGARVAAFSAAAKTLVPILTIALFIFVSNVVGPNGFNFPLLTATVAAVWLSVDTIGWWLAVTPPRGVPSFWAGPIAWCSRAAGAAAPLLLAWSAYEEFTRVPPWNSTPEILFLLGLGMWWVRDLAGSWALHRLLRRVYPWPKDLALHTFVTLALLGLTGGVMVGYALAFNGGPGGGLLVLPMIVLACLAWAFTIAALANVADLLVFEWAGRKAERHEKEKTLE